MKIGIDLDGVIYDSEKEFRIYTELYDMLELKQNNKKNENAVRIMDRFDWTDEQFDKFIDKYYLNIIKQANYMPGAQEILNRLKKDGHEFIMITARGGYREEIKCVTDERLKEDDMEIFEKKYYAINNKGEICEKENIDLMIDDSPENCKCVSNRKIKTIYLKDAPSYDIEENEYVKVLYNWGEIYRYIKEMEK